MKGFILQGLLALVILVSFFALVIQASSEENTGLDHPIKVKLGANLLTIEGEITPQSTEAFITALAQYDPSTPVTIYIDSPGGSVFDALKIESALDNHDNYTCIASQAISAAFMIFESCKVREVTKFSVLMQHEASFGVPAMQEHNVLSFVAFSVRLIELQSAKEAKRLKLSLPEFKAKIAKDWWIFGEDILLNNAADKLVSLTCTPELIAGHRKMTVQTLFGPQKVDASTCPIL